MVAHNKFSFEEVKRFVEQNSNCQLLSNKYERAIAKMVFRCGCGEVFETSFSKFKSRNKRQCNKCSKVEKPNLKSVVKLCEESGLKPLFNRYTNSKQRILVETTEGYRFLTTYHQLKLGIKKKPIFHTYNPYTIENIKRYINNNEIECELLSEHYKGNNTHKLNFKCKCGNVFSVVWNEFYTSGKTQCNNCGIKKRSGKNHYDYNPNLTPEERVRRRVVTPNENMRVFRNSVFERDNYTCIICGDRSGEGNPVTLHAHHLDGYHWFIDGRFDPENGVTLCSVCHDKFHGIYGKRNNTKEQFEEFKRKIKYTKLQHA